MKDNFEKYFISKENDLPILIASEKLFDSQDDKARFLIEKLQAWLNYQGLVANWFGDENKLLKLKIVLIPESYLSNLSSEFNADWQQYKIASLKGLKKITEVNGDTSSLDVKAFVAISNEELKQMMESPAQVEARFQQVLKASSNYLLDGYNYKRL